MSGGMPVRPAWSQSYRVVPRTVVRPLERMLDHHAAGGVVMRVVEAVAPLWASSDTPEDDQTAATAEPWHEPQQPGGG